MHDYDPEGRRLPIKIDSASNGEHAPIPLTLAQKAGKTQAHEAVDIYSRKVRPIARGASIGLSGLFGAWP